MAEAETADVGDVTHSAAFLALDGLLVQRKIPEAQAQALKEKYKQLHDRVLALHRNDAVLLKKAKAIRKDLDAEKSRVDYCGDVAKDNDATIQQLKRELALVEGELAVAQEKESMLQVETIELERKKTSLQNEVDDAITEEENRMRPHIESLTKTITELKEEIEQTADKFEKYKVEREEAIRRDRDLRESMEQADSEVYERKLQLTKIDREPTRARKQADIVEKAMQTALRELASLNDKLKALAATTADHGERRKTMEEQRYELALTLETQRTAIEQREKMMDAIERNLESERDSNFRLVQTSASLEASLKMLAISLSKETEALNRSIKEKETGLRTFQRIDQAKRELVLERESLLKQQESLHRALNTVKVQRRKLKDELEELKRDVDILINNFLKEEIHEKDQTEVMANLLKQVKLLEKTIAQKTEAEQANLRLMADLSVLRENKSREAARTKGKLEATKDDLKVKEVIIKELQKRNNELLARLTQLTDMYSVVKRERSNKASLIQSASQAVSETQEKIRILENELEVLRRESLSKDKALVKVRRELHDERANCENLRVETNRLYNGYKQRKKEIQEQCSQINKLNSDITAMETEMLHLKRKYEGAVEDRNFTGIQLIDRNDELCILYEKCNIQETILKNGQLQLSKREDEIRAMAIELGNVQREIVNCQKQLPKLREYEEELSTLQDELEDERWRVETLEEDLVDPSNESRWRKLGKVKRGTDEAEQLETAEELMAKEQELEQRLYREHERLMEKELILEEVSEMSERLRKQTTNGREYTLELAKKVNTWQHSIKQKTKKMMATLSELSVVQATSIKLQSDVAEIQAVAEEAKERLDQGLPPTNDAEVEFQRVERDRLRRQEELLATQQRRKAEATMPAQVTRTMADQRPNAYIPDSELMLPRPYGSHQPFKSTGPSATMMKYVRRPNPAPVQL
eukprot:GGOE01053773.1.p1 GENE.GGOE01053773.1~~GGOE01053773.1.p1  ORF type:complete len:936 (-),score=463.19 GGOE01053773.1:231-3038(-)